MDAAKKKRVLKLLAGRKADREQAIELLAALDDEALWQDALATVRTTAVAGVPTVYQEDLPLLAAAPPELPAVRAAVSTVTRSYFSSEVPEAARCLSALEEVHLTAAWGGDTPVASPSLANLHGAPVTSLHLIGVDLGDGGVLSAWRLRVLEDRNAAWATLPVLPHLEELSASSRALVRTLGAGLPGLRRVELDCPALADLGALAVAGGLEELTIESAGAVADWSPVERAVAAGAPLRVVKLEGASALTSLGGLARSAALRRLEVEGSPITSLDPVSSAVGLEWLAVRGAPLVSVGPAAALPALRCLDLRGCASVTDVGPLVASRSLRVVALHGTGVRPDAVPTVLLPYCTWAPEVRLEPLADRPAHPDDPRGSR